MQTRGATFIVWGWRPHILKGVANEGHEEIWSKKEAITSLYWTIPNCWEVWKCGIQIGVTTIIGRSSRHLARISTKEVFEGTHGCRIAEVAPLETDLTYPEHLITILDQKSCVTRRKMIKFYKIQWSNHMVEESTWESEDFLRSRHPDFELP
jgi:hypothetical protein